MDGIFAFDEADDLGDGIFRWNRDYHMHVVAHHVPFLDPTFLLPIQCVKDSAEMLAQLTVEHLSLLFGYKGDAIFAILL